MTEVAVVVAEEEGDGGVKVRVPSSSSSSSSSWLWRWRWTIGMLYVLAVAVIWIAASFVVQSVVEDGVPPFLITYICNCLFLVYIPLVELSRLFPCQSMTMASVRPQIQLVKSNKEEEEEEEDDNDDDDCRLLLAQYSDSAPRLQRQQNVSEGGKGFDLEYPQKESDAENDVSVGMVFDSRQLLQMESNIGGDVLRERGFDSEYPQKELNTENNDLRGKGSDYECTHLESNTKNDVSRGENCDSEYLCPESNMKNDDLRGGKSDLEYLHQELNTKINVSRGQTSDSEYLHPESITKNNIPRGEKSDSEYLHPELNTKINVLRGKGSDLECLRLESNGYNHFSKGKGFNSEYLQLESNSNYDVSRGNKFNSEEVTLSGSVQRIWSRREIAWISFLICPFWFLAQFTFNLSLKYTTVTSNTILGSTASLFTFFMSLCFLDEKFTWLKFWSIILCMAGTITVSLADSESADKVASHPVLGDMLCLSSGLFYAAYTTLIRKRLPDEEKGEGKASTALFFGFLGLFNGLLFLPVVLALHFTGVEPLHRLSASQLSLVFGKGFLDNVLSDYLWAKAVLLTSTTAATVGLSIQVPIAAIVDLVRGEIPHVWDIIGGLAISLGFLGINLPMPGRQLNDEEEDHVNSSSMITSACTDGGFNR